MLTHAGNGHIVFGAMADPVRRAAVGGASAGLCRTDERGRDPHTPPRGAHCRPPCGWVRKY